MRRGATGTNGGEGEWYRVPAAWERPPNARDYPPLPNITERPPNAIDYPPVPNITERPPGAADYWNKSAKQILLGNYNDDDVTLLGTARQIGLGLTGLDFAGDIRDLAYDVTHWQWTPRHVAQTVLDAVGLLPIVGTLKNVDEVVELAKNGLKHADEAAALAKTLFADTVEEAEDAVTNVGKRTNRAAKGAGETKLYRVMSDAEHQSIINNGGKFSKYDRAMEEKWFATSPEDAAKWAEKFYPDGRYKMIEIEVPTDSLNQMYQVGKLDGIGPAYSGGIDFLNSIMKGLKLR